MLARREESEAGFEGGERCGFLLEGRHFTGRWYVEGSGGNGR